jgi:hypothetical protein
MAAQWPTSLQQFFSEEGFGLTIGNTTIVSDNDIGPKKRRRRFSRSIDRMTASIFLTTAQYNTFRTFFDTTLAGGVLPFEFLHPVTGVLTDFKFEPEPQVVSLGGGQYRVSFSLEVQP